VKLPYRISAAIGLVVILCFLAGAQKPPLLYVRPAQTVDLEAAKLVTAEQNCQNWAIAAGLEAVLKQQDVALDQRFWVTRISGGEVCDSEIPSTEKIRQAVNGEFVLDDGRHVRLELHYAAGAPTNVDAVIAALKQQQLSLLLLHGHVYYLTGITYDDHLNQAGGHMFIVTELRLANTFAKQPGLAFVKGRDNMEEIQAVIGVTVTRL
jgi:hypothetical protein